MDNFIPKIPKNLISKGIDIENRRLAYQNDKSERKLQINNQYLIHPSIIQKLTPVKVLVK